MYEDQTYEAILDRTLARVSTDVDKREGSLVMNAVAPTSAEHANIYILLDSAIRNGYIATANIREFIVYRCKERGIIPFEATKAILKGKFNMKIPINSRFSHDELNYITLKFIEEKENFFYYQMECETFGEIGNKSFGELNSIDFFNKDLEGELVELLIPAEDEESDESLKQRYNNSFKSEAYNWNKQDYKEKTKAIGGGGGCIVKSVWNGGGTVKLLIVDSEYNKATSTLTEKIENILDPEPKGEGNGMVPVGHTVTVVTPDTATLQIRVKITFQAGYDWNNKKALITKALQDYFLELRKSWEDGNLVVRVSQIENRILNIEGVLDVADTSINGVADNYTLQNDQLPILGGVENNG